ncbi:hypothetical protein TRFO_38469 [Tritrichomonas foetus]|uniref:Uncharacterized protein n=1 Tax=Tritrichomonas foetus TaxID=1144522 RepID=A0A1J4JDC8_9EUKA|nr:hypothetical protein TRFO_38469 [Tritrichomonas foetus]|eukprot:OHS95437.1 hypothetical protein TRFO_38469 [Tritrichomonas foetus]
MRSIDKQIPIFPSSFHPDNRDAIDFSPYDIVAVGSGSTINFSYVKNFKLNQGYSISIGSNIVTSLRFHPYHELLYIGDSKGFIYLFDYKSRSFSSHPFMLNDYTCVQQIEIYENGILVFYKNQVLAYFKLSQKNNTNLFNFACVWKIVLPAKITNFCLDPFKRGRLFVYGKNTNFFMLYSLSRNSSSNNSPSPLTEQLFLTGNLNIQNAQFSLHLRNYVFIITETNIMLYNLECNIVVSVSHYQKTASFLDNMIQFPTDDSKILCFHKSGTITLFNVREPFNLFSMNEISHTLQNQQLFNYKLSPIRDDYLICSYLPLGVALLDLSTFNLISIVPFWCDTTTAFSTNGTFYAIGTHKGFINAGHLFNPDEKTVFKVSEKPVTFVSQYPTKNLVFWTTDSEVGVIDVSIRQVKLYPEHCLNTQRAVGSRDGGLMVQRESCVLGLFIDGKEICIPTNAPIIDFCFNDENSGVSSGSAMILLESGVIVFSNYSRNHGVCQPFLKRVLESPFGIRCITWCGGKFAVGYFDGTILLMLTNSLEQVKYDINSVRSSPIKQLQFCENELFGLTEDGLLFRIKDNKVFPCHFSVKTFSVVNNNLLSVIGSDSSVYFVKRADFEQLYLHSKVLPLPDKDAYLTDFIKGNPVLNEEDEYAAIPTILKEELSCKPEQREISYLTKAGRDFWLHLLKRHSLRLMQVSAVGKSIRYESTLADIFSLLDYKEELQSLMFDAYLFAHRIDDANNLLSKSDPSKPSFMLHSIIATAMLSFDEELLDEQCAWIKPAGISLIMNHKSKEGSRLLRLAKLDSIAVGYLIQSNHLYEAMRFVRASLHSSDKKKYCFEIANIFYDRRRLWEAMLLYLTAGEYHPALFCLYKLRSVEDAYVIKTYLVRMGLLHELDHHKAINVHNLMPLKKLISTIDSQFASLLDKLCIPLANYVLAARPRTFSTP